MGTRFTDGAGNRLWEDYSTGGAAGKGAYAAGDEIMRLDVAGCGSRIVIRPINDFATAGATATAQWSLDGVEWDPVTYFDPTAQAVTTTGVFALGSGKPLIFPDIGNYFRIIANQAGTFANPAAPNLIAGYTDDDGYQFSAAAPGSGGGGGGGGGATTIANGSDVAEGSTTDPATASGANTTVIGALRAMRDKLLGTLTTTISGTVAVTGTFFQAKQPVTSADGDLATIGTTTDAATASGANSSVVGALRAIRDKLLGTLTITGVVGSGDGNIITIGTTTDAATASGANTTVIGALRAIRDKLLGVLSANLFVGGAANASGNPLFAQLTGGSASALGQYASTLQTLASGAFGGAFLDRRSNFKTSPTGSDDPLVGIAPVATTAVASNLVLKSGPGNLYELNIVSGGTAGYIMLFDATAAPADGTVTPKWTMPLAANTGYSGAPSASNIPMNFATGITVVFSSTGPFTKTASATAFISGLSR